MNWNEGLIGISIGVATGKLNRLVRATQGYTKIVEVLVYSVALLLANWTSKPNASLC